MPVAACRRDSALGSRTCQLRMIAHIGDHRVQGMLLQQRIGIKEQNEFTPSLFQRQIIRSGKTDILFQADKLNLREQGWR